MISSAPVGWLALKWNEEYKLLENGDICDIHFGRKDPLTKRK